MFRFPLLRLVLTCAKNFEDVPLHDAIGLALSRWMDELATWLAITGDDQHDRETRNHNPWDDAGAFSDPVAFEQ